MRAFLWTRWVREVSDRHPLINGLVLLALALLYFVAAELGLRLASIHASASPVWPATGLAFATLLLFGTRMWPAIFAGAFAANLAGNSIPVALGIATGNTLEAVVAAYLINRYAGGRRTFDHPTRVLRYALLGLPATAVSALIGVASLCLGGRAEVARFVPIAFTWWLGDYGGYLVLGPLLVLLGTRFTRGWNRSRTIEAIGVGLLVLLIDGWVFNSQFPLPGRTYPLSFAAVPPVLWAAFRFQRHGAAAAVVLSAMLAIMGTTRGVGPFALDDQNASLLISQSFMGMMALAGLLFGSAMHERIRVERGLRVAGRKLGLRFRANQLDLANTVEALDSASAELLRINAELELRVRARTAELERSNQELERFAVAAAHDLYQPLRTVNWYSQMLRERILAQNSDDANSMVGRIDDCVTWMKATIDGLLTYSKVSEATPRRDAVDAGLALERALRNLAPRILETGSFIDHRPLPEVRADESLLTQVFQNLIDNAIKYRSNEAPRIQISARRHDDYWEFAVRDNGIGIPAAHLENVFDLLRRFHSRDSRGGAGIGLATCRRIIERLGGRMWAESGSEGGTTFYFTLAATTRSRVERHGEAGADQDPNSRKLHDPTAASDSRTPEPDRSVAASDPSGRTWHGAAAPLQD